MGRVQFGLIVPEDVHGSAGRAHYREQVDRLLATVTGHFDSAWCIDHLQGDVLEGWTTLAYLAARHPDLRWGHTVLAQSFRNPALVAKMGATFQFLSGGRFILGLGAGGQEDEHRAYGYDFPSPGARVAALDEALAAIKALWTRERATFTGRYYRVAGASCEPRPDPRPRMLRLAARQADWWNVSSTGIAAYRAHHRAFLRACDEVGRDPASVRRTWSGGCICAPDAATIAELAAVRARRGAEYAHQVGEDFVGTPAQLIDQMRPFVELGVEYFMLDCGGFPRLTTVELLIREVLPALNA